MLVVPKDFFSSFKSRELDDSNSAIELRKGTYILNRSR